MKLSAEQIATLEKFFLPKCRDFINAICFSGGSIIPKLIDEAYSPTGHTTLKDFFNDTSKVRAILNIDQVDIADIREIIIQCLLVKLEEKKEEGIIKKERIEALCTEVNILAKNTSITAPQILSPASMPVSLKSLQWSPGFSYCSNTVSNTAFVSQSFELANVLSEHLSKLSNILKPELIQLAVESNVIELVSYSDSLKQANGIILDFITTQTVKSNAFTKPNGDILQLNIKEYSDFYPIVDCLKESLPPVIEQIRQAKNSILQPLAGILVGAMTLLEKIKTAFDQIAAADAQVYVPYSSCF